jgi:tripartite-type tricarboxylate transporter receptor subunit TctC
VKYEGIMSNTTRAIAAVMLLAAGAANPVAADEIADFYKSKPVNIVVGHEPATGFDVYARVLARHLGRHIPGNPNIVVQNMTGASGITAANWLYNVAPKDGTIMATFVHTVPFEPLMGNNAARFEAGKFAWIGNMEESVAVCGISKAAGITKFEDMLKKDTIWGATGATGPLVKSAAAVKNLLGAKMKIVAGYKGSASVKIAITRDEVHGICGLPMSTILSAWSDLYNAGEFRPVIQLSGRKQPDLKGIPHVDDYAKTESDRQTFGLIFGTQALGRIYLSPPGTPVARRDALRAGLLAAMKDPQFIADAKKTKIDISPMTGAEVEQLIARLSSAPPAVVERVKQAVKVD